MSVLSIFESLILLLVGHLVNFLVYILVYILDYIFQGFLNKSANLAKDIDAFFVGWIDSSVSSTVYPYFLKVTGFFRSEVSLQGTVSVCLPVRRYMAIFFYARQNVILFVITHSTFLRNVLMKWVLSPHLHTSIPV